MRYFQIDTTDFDQDNYGELIVSNFADGLNYDAKEYLS